MYGSGTYGSGTSGSGALVGILCGSGIYGSCKYDSGTRESDTTGSGTYGSGISGSGAYIRAEGYIQEKYISTTMKRCTFSRFNQCQHTH